MKSKKKYEDKDLELAVENYEASDSDDGGLDGEGKAMLARARHGRYINDESEEEVLKVLSSEDDSDGEIDEGDVGSDFEGKEVDRGLPDRRAWGSTKNSYYNTDYVDNDYGGLGKDEEEAALMEEVEALEIQKRMLRDMEDADFTMGFLDKVDKKRQELFEKSRGVLREAAGTSQERIRTDFSKLTDEEKQDFLEKESPELLPLISDMKERLLFARDKLEPVLKMVKTGEVPNCEAADFLRVYYNIILNYAVNVSFYLVVKSQKSAEGHPVMSRVGAYRRLLQEMDAVFEEVVLPQVEAILNTEGELIVAPLPPPEPCAAPPRNRAEKRKKQLKVVEKMKAVEEEVEWKRKQLEGATSEGDQRKVRFVEPQSDLDSEQGAEDDDGEEGMVEERRSISYQMQKNKGLTPRRKKEQRNPRVKHRNKFRKAKIRRKGQVREVRTEKEKYAGEVSGIKAFVSKSVKFK